MATPFSNRATPSVDPGVATFAFRILLASLSMIFLATLVAYAIVRGSNEVWRTSEMPTLPLGLLASTVLLIGVSAALERARRQFRDNDPQRARVALQIAGVASVAFLVGQALNWQQMNVPAGPVRTLYVFTFYMLTGTHALHAIGGLVPLALVMWRAERGEYSSSNHHGVTLCAQYWHYLGVVWLVLLAALWWGSL